MKHIPTLEYVEKIRKASGVSPFEDEQAEIDAADLYHIFNYAAFQNLKPGLWMFVPCDENGEPLQEPLYSQGEPDRNFDFDERFQKFQQAKERVLFKGFALRRPAWAPQYVMAVTDGNFYPFWCSPESGWRPRHGFTNLEAIAIVGLELTNYAMQKYKLYEPKDIVFENTNRHG